MIEINNLTSQNIDKSLFKKIVNNIFKKEGKQNFDISIALVDGKRIRELNKKYRRKPKATDVLSFQYGKEGELIICPSEARKNAKKFKNSFKKEISRVLIHGVLHLLGYDHERNEKEEKKMRQKEDYYLAKI